jgi:hypothetical protein
VAFFFFGLDGVCGIRYIGAARNFELEKKCREGQIDSSAFASVAW